MINRTDLRRSPQRYSRGVKGIFETPHNEIKCVLSILESYSIEQMGQNFQICLRSGPTGLTPPPYGQPDCKIYVFYESPKHSPKLPFSFNCITLGKNFFWKAQGVAVRPRRLFFLSYGYKIASVS